jgi:CBS domain-containing protein
MALHPDSMRLAESRTFSGMDDAVVSALVKHSVRETLAKGGVLFTRGIPYQQRLYILLEGQITLLRETDNKITYQTGEIIGLSNYLDKSPYVATAVAEENSIILRINEDDFAALEKRYPVLANRIDGIIANRIRARLTTSRAVRGVMGEPVYSVMTSPLAECTSHTTIRDAHKIMQARKIGSLAVFDDSHRLIGMLTFAGLCDALLLKDANPDTPVVDAACESSITISADAPLWHAEDTLQQQHAKYLVVLRDGEPAGLVSQTDLFRARLREQSAISQDIARAQTLAELRDYYRNIPELAEDARHRHHYATQAVYEISEIHLAIQRRCVELTLTELDSEGLGSAPRGYSLLVMGSGGRHEMLLNPDQDNGLIIDDAGGELNRDEQNWFMQFAKRLNQNLDKAGYILCPGDIMARNPMFHKTLHQWIRQIQHMVTQPNNKSARWGNIVFDFITLYGDDSLTHRLRKHLLSEIHNNSALLGYMVEDDAEGRPPLGLFNRLLTSDDRAHRGTIDIKRNGLRLVGDAARIYGLHAGLQVTNTRERLRRLVHQGVLNRDLVDSVLAAFDELLDLLLVHQITQARAGLAPDKFINPDALPWQTRSVLQVSMRAVKRLQDQLQGQFGRTVF